MIASIFLCVHIKLQPFDDDNDDNLTGVGQIATVLTLIGAALIKSGDKGGGVLAVVMLINICVMLIALYNLVFDELPALWDEFQSYKENAMAMLQKAKDKLDGMAEDSDSPKTDDEDTPLSPRSRRDGSDNDAIHVIKLDSEPLPDVQSNPLAEGRASKYLSQEDLDFCSFHNPHQQPDSLKTEVQPQHWSSPSEFTTMSSPSTATEIGFDLPTFVPRYYNETSDLNLSECGTNPLAELQDKYVVKSSDENRGTVQGCGTVPTEIELPTYSSTAREYNVTSDMLQEAQAHFESATSDLLAAESDEAGGSDQSHVNRNRIIDI